MSGTGKRRLGARIVRLMTSAACAASLTILALGALCTRPLPEQTPENLDGTTNHNGKDATNNPSGTGNDDPTQKTPPPPLVATAKAVDSPLVELGRAVELAAEASGGTPPYSYVWTQTSGAHCQLTPPEGAARTVTAKPSRTGSSAYRVVVQDSAGETAAANVALETWVAPVAAEAGPNQLVSVQDCVTLEARGFNGAQPLTCEWKQISGPPQTMVPADGKAWSVTVCGDTEGVCEFEARVTDAEGNTQTDICVLNAAAALSCDGGGEVSAAPGAPVVLNGKVVGGVAPYGCQWTQVSGPAMLMDPPDGKAANVHVTGAAPGTAMFNFAVTDSAGKTCACDVQVMVSSDPLTITCPEKKTVEVDETCVLGVTASKGKPPYSYEWVQLSGPEQTIDPADGKSADLSVLGVTPGTCVFKAKVTDSNYDVATCTVEVWVTYSPLQAFASGDSSIRIGETGTLYGSATGGVKPYTYQWSQKAGSLQKMIPTDGLAKDLGVLGQAVGDCKFELTVTDKTGASAKATADLGVLDLTKLFLTLDIDYLVGTDQDDKFIAPAVWDALEQTLQTGDEVYGLGGWDLLDATLIGFYARPFLTDIEELNLTALLATEIDAQDSTGIQQVNSKMSIGTPEVSNLNAIVDASIKNSDAGLTLAFQPSATTGDADRLRLTLENVHFGDFTLNADPDNGIEELQIHSRGDNTLTALVSGGLNLVSPSRLEITAAALKIERALPGQIRNIDASGAAGPTSLLVNPVVPINPTGLLNYLGSPGNDVLEFSAAWPPVPFDPMNAIDGNEGYDELRLPSKTAATVFVPVNITNIEQLTITDPLGSIVMDNLMFIPLVVLEQGFEFLNSSGPRNDSNGVLGCFFGGVLWLNHTYKVVVPVDSGPGTIIGVPLPLPGPVGGPSITYKAIHSASFGLCLVEVINLNLESFGASNTGWNTFEYLNFLNLVVPANIDITGDTAVGICYISAPPGSTLNAGQFDQSVTLGGCGLLPETSDVGYDGVPPGSVNAINIIGSTDSDNLVGSWEDDKINARAGVDYIYGLRGDDELFGGPGNDYIDGGKGRDLIHGGGQWDELWGGYDGDTFLFDTALPSAPIPTGAKVPFVQDFYLWDDVIAISANDSAFANCAPGGLAQAGGGPGSLAPTLPGAVQILELDNDEPGTPVEYAQFILLTEEVYPGATDQDTYDAAIGSSSVTGLTVGTSMAGAYFDKYHDQLVFIVITDSNGDQTLTAGDRIHVVARVYLYGNNVIVPASGGSSWYRPHFDKKNLRFQP